MKKITLLLTLCLIVLLPITYGQCNGNLSSKGYAHIKAAQTLTDMATTISDWKDVAIEYEQVIVSDPDYAPVYMILGDLYTKIGNEEGVEAFNMAEYYYNGCKTACADSADAIEVKLTILNALKRKYSNGPNRFVGTWGTRFSKYVDISYDGNSYKFKNINYGNSKNDYGFKVISEMSNEIKFEFHTIFDRRDELRNKGWTHYYDDCNYLADPGYPTSGIYKYDYEDVRYTFSISVIDDDVFVNFLEIQANYYLKGQKTYADTESNFLPSQKLEKLQ